MSAREFPNTLDDYVTTSTELISKSGKFIDEISERLNSGVTKLVAKLNDGLQRDSSSDGDYSIYTGKTGIALLYLHLYNTNSDETYLTKAEEYISKSLKHLKGRRATFLCGDAGPLAVGSVVYNKMGKKQKSKDCVERLQKLVDIVLDESIPDELLYGRAGYLYALLFVEHFLGEETIQKNIIEKVTMMVLDSGKALARKEKSKSPLMYKWHDKQYLGAAHGLAGIYFLLLQVDLPVISSHLDDVIKPSIDYLTRLQFPSGNYPSSLGNDTDRLIHWCHGAAGVVHLMLQAYKFGDQKYLDQAESCGNVIWARGLLRKGYGLCHGTSGNGYAFVALYQVTGNQKHLHRAWKFAEWCLDYDKHGCRQPDRPFSLFEGMAGAIYYLSDVLHPLKAKFPAFYL
ncbi:lanC-like protein 2 isoform X2 [Anneissia japonica]|uniref:lanC-like protein 2 isoform X2 n=1 Tax=Anneissia japonica TaxID=1529436 RepID=UPI001425B3E1|nr:lanC-like protein 2 isoform X2 [Anneissia japonica]